MPRLRQPVKTCRFVSATLVLLCVSAGAVSADVSGDVVDQFGHAVPRAYVRALDPSGIELIQRVYRPSRTIRAADHRQRLPRGGESHGLSSRERVVPVSRRGTTCEGTPCSRGRSHSGNHDRDGHANRSADEPGGCERDRLHGRRPRAATHTAPRGSARRHARRHGDPQRWSRRADVAFRTRRRERLQQSAARRCAAQRAWRCVLSQQPHH